MELAWDTSLFFPFFISAILWALVWIEKNLPRKSSLLADKELRFWWIRAYAIISLLWAICTWLDNHFWQVIFTIIWVIIVSVFVAIPYVYNVFKLKNLSFASEYWAIATYFIWVFVILWNIKFAIIFSVLLTLLLSLKEYFSNIKNIVSREELHNSLKFAVIALVILPILPDQRYSISNLLNSIGFESLSNINLSILNMEFFNPSSLWFFVVAMSAISYIWYIFTKIIWKKWSVIISSALWWLISSTAVTATMAEQSKKDKTNSSIYVFWALIASSIMFLRVILIVLLFNISLIKEISIPAWLMFIALLWSVWYFYYTSKSWSGEKTVSIENKIESPFSIAPALKFALFILFIKFVAWIWILYKDIWGEWLFYYVLWIISWLADVDAITQTMAVEAWVWGIWATVAIYTILIAVISNNLVKWSMAMKFWEKAFWRKVMISFIITMIVWVATMIII